MSSFYSREDAAQAAIRRRVRKGVKLLDLAQPGWRDKLSRNDRHAIMRIDNCNDCVFGLLFGSFERGVAHFFGRDNFDAAGNYGFTLALSKRPDWMTIGEYWQRLQATWLRELNR